MDIQQPPPTRGTVDVTTNPGTTSYRALAQSEGSLVGTVVSSVNPVGTISPSAPAIMPATFLTAATGAKQLCSAFTTLGTGTKAPSISFAGMPPGDDPAVLANAISASQRSRLAVR